MDSTVKNEINISISESRQAIEGNLSGKKQSRLKVRAFYRLALLFIATLFQILLLITERIVKGKNPHRQAEHAQRWGAMLVNLLGVKVDARGEIPPQGVLLVSNHRSYIDIAVILKTFPVCFLAKAEIVSWPILGYAAQLGNCVFVKRDDHGSRLTAIRGVLRRLKEGLSLAIFPEGTTFEGPGILPFHKGIFRLAAKKEIPVVPVSITYEYKEDAWVGDDTFVGHFLRVFCKKEIPARIMYGPVLRESDPEVLLNSAWSWINDASLSS